MKAMCPVCGTGECKYRQGIFCTMWVCATGKFKQKGIDGVERPVGAGEDGYGGFGGILDMLKKACGEDREKQA